MADIFDFLKNKTLPSSYLGIDIGTTSVKAVEIHGGNQRPKLMNYGILESRGHLIRANKVLQTSGFKIFESEVTNLIRALIAKMKPRTDEVVASLPAFASFMTMVDMPRMTNEELKSAITFQARQYIPLPISEVSLEWMKVGEYVNDKGFPHDRILLISVPLEQVRKFQSIFQTAGLRLRALEVESFGLVRSVIGTDPTTTLIIDIGSRATNMVIASNGQLTFNAHGDYASASLTQALAASLNINPLRAEELKRERGIVHAGANFELSTIMLPFIDVIISEVKKALYNYKTQSPGAKDPERVLLAGGGANLLGIDRYIQEQLDLPVSKATPFVRLEYDGALEPLIPELNPILSVAIGVGMRELVNA